MSVAENKSIYISIWIYGEGWIPAGTITFNESVGLSGFSYFNSYINNDYPPLNPATLNYRQTQSRHFAIDPRTNKHMLDRTFWELLPMTGDFCTNVLLSRHPEYQTMTHVQKLYFLGNRMVGGLASYVGKEREESSIDSLSWLDQLRKESVDFHLREVSRMYDYKAFDALTSYGGARPKAMYKEKDGTYWIAKFNIPTDPYNMARVEHTAMLMAQASGVIVPRTKVIVLPSGEDVFLTERFDRKDGERAHGLALFSMLPGVHIDKDKLNNPMAPHLKGNLSSVMATIVRAVSDFKDADTMNLVLKLLIDVGFNNTDNHLRNTRMILNRNNKWELSPVFDVIFNPASQPFTYNPGGLILNETHLTSDKLVEGISKQTGVNAEMIAIAANKVKGVTENFNKYCDLAGVSMDDRKKIEMAINLGTHGPEAVFRHEQKMKEKLKENMVKNMKRPKPH